MEHNVIWQPNPGPQTEFLQSSAFETLFGGGRGGGKTDGLIIDALGLNNIGADGALLPPAVQNAAYRGILLRSHIKDTTEVIDRGEAIYTAVDPGCRWVAGDQWFEFSSGARIEIGHAREEKDITKYRSREFQWVGWEELTEQASPRFYDALLQCCRGGPKVAGIPLRIRATTNPTGPGQQWVKKHWRINDDGESVAPFCVNPDAPEARRMYRQFIRSLARDNPCVDSMYETRLALIEDDDERDAMLNGSWKIPQLKGAIYGTEMERVMRENRITTVRYDRGLPVETFWDIGANDTTAIWFMQHAGGAYRFIDYYENSFQPLVTYVEAMRDRGYLYGMHYLPHDAANSRLGAYDNSSVQDQLRQLGVGHTYIVPRAQSRIDGINLTRRALSVATFDGDRCERGLAALREYRWKLSSSGDSTGQPAHTWASNGADAFRQFAQVYYRGALEDASALPAFQPAPMGRRDRPEVKDYSWLV